MYKRLIVLLMELERVLLISISMIKLKNFKRKFLVIKRFMIFLFELKIILIFIFDMKFLFLNIKWYQVFIKLNFILILIKNDIIRNFRSKSVAKTVLSNLGWISDKIPVRYETDFFPFNNLTHYTFVMEIFWYELPCEVFLLFVGK